MSTMDPLNIHHVIRHRLSRIETNNFQDKSGCSINGFRSFLFEQGIVRNLDEMEKLINNYETIQDYRGYPFRPLIRYNSHNPVLSDEILRMKNVRFIFQDQRKPIHKLVSPEPHFVEEERNLIDKYLFYFKTGGNKDNFEDWECFEMDCEGHLVSILTPHLANFQLTNESIEHLSNFPHLRNLQIHSIRSSSWDYDANVANLSLLSNLKQLSLSYESNIKATELFQNLGLFSNLLYLFLYNHQSTF